MKKLLIFLSLCLFLVLAGCSSEAKAKPASFTGQLRGAVVEPPRKIQDFTLPSTTGDDFTLSAYKGKVVLFYFGYMTCPDVCPTTFADLRQVYTHLGDLADKVQVVFVTVDPERDTLERLTLYTRGFHEDFIAVRGEGDTLQAILDNFGVKATRRVVGESALSYLIDHTASIFLVGPDGRLLEQFMYGTRYQDIVQDVTLILEK